MKNVVLPADTFVVINKTVLTEQDRKIITMLYQPIISSISSSLFFTFWSYLDKSEILSEQYTHHELMSNMKLSLEDIIEAREKLEGVGLIKTYLKKGNVNNYVYELYSPLSAYEFFNNPILDVTLLNNVGKSNYKKLIQYFKLPNIKKSEYEDITCSFTDVFENVSNISNNEYQEIKKISKNSINIKSKINIDYLIEMIPTEVLDKRRITNELKNIIIKLSFVYNLSEQDLYDVILSSVNEEKKIDIDNLKTNCRKYYSFENKGKITNLIYKEQPATLRKNLTDMSDRSKIIYKFETTSPYEFLYEKNNFTKPSFSDLKILEFLLLEQNLNPGVVNVLIDYVLRINNNKLVKTFVTSISSQWVRSKVKTVEEAMQLAEKEYKSRKSSTKLKTIKVESKPDWFDKNIDESIVSEEEQLEFEKKLKNMK